MIEKILNLDREMVEIDFLDKMTIQELELLKKEVQLIANKTPECTITYIAGGHSKYKKNEKITGLDSLWEHVNICITNKKKFRIVK